MESYLGGTVPKFAAQLGGSRDSLRIPIEVVDGNRFLFVS